MTEGKRLVTPERYIGISTDTKPTGVRPGATFYEYDEDLMYITYDGTNWVTKASADQIGYLSAGSASIGTVGVDAGIASIGTVGINTGTNRMGIALEDPHEVRVSKAIAGGSAYTAGDVVSDDDCCSTASYWTFAGMANAGGGYGVIDFATIFDETKNVSPRLTMIFYNAPPTSEEFMDNQPSNSPKPANRAKWVGEIAWSALKAVSTEASSTSQASPSTVGNLPLFYKCAIGSTSLYGILKTLDVFTQVATNDIEIALQTKHL